MHLDKLKNNIFLKLKLWFTHETHALPVDIFRILVGILCVFYFFFALIEVKDFSSPDGLIDHDFYLETFWWLNINLIQPGISVTVFYSLLGFAFAGSFGIIAGYRVKLLAAILFLITTCVQRWNFAVMFVDDCVMHLLLFWLLLLPVGRTLVLGEWLREGGGCFSKWLDVKVPGFAVSCFIGNVCWIYFLAGITKLASPLWQEGLALYAVLLVPISRAPDFWGPEHVPFLKLLTYAALVTEIAIPFLLLSPKWSLRKWLGLAFQISFNLGIVLTLKIPFANIALIASAVLFFREEMMEALLRRYRPAAQENLPSVDFPVAEGGLKRLGKVNALSIFALVFVVLVCLSTLRRVPVLEYVGKPVTAALWMIGVAQDYKLFDWIDRMNYHIDREVKFYPSGGYEPEYINPSVVVSHSTRHTLIQTRIYDVYWAFSIPRKSKDELKRKTRRRFKSRACREINETGRFVIKTTLHRVTMDNVDLRKRPKVDVMRFRCFGKNLLNRRG